MIAAVHEQAAGFPEPVHLLGSSLLAVAEDWNDVDDADDSRAVERVVLDVRRNWLDKRLKKAGGRKYQDILQGMAAHDKPNVPLKVIEKAIGQSQNQFSANMGILLEREVIDRVDVGVYTFRDPLLREYIRRFGSGALMPSDVHLMRAPLLVSRDRATDPSGAGCLRPHRLGIERRSPSGADLPTRGHRVSITRGCRFSTVAGVADHFGFPDRRAPLVPVGYLPARRALGGLERHRRWERSWSRLCCWMLLVAAGRRPRCPVIAAVSRRTTRACAIPPIRRRSKKSCSSCAMPVIARMACDCVG